MSKLKKYAVAATMAVPLSTADASTTQAETTSHTEPWGIIDTKGLEILMDSATPLTLLDARTDQWFDGTLIKGAVRLPADTSEETIRKSLLKPHGLIVVYCAGEKCPASKNLAKRLVEFGYKFVLDYHDGIQVWKSLNKPIQKSPA